MANKITHEGELNLNGLIVPCYILEDGERVLSTLGMQKALGIIDNSNHKQSSGRLDEMLSSPYVTRLLSDNEDPSKYSPITCYKGQTKIRAYKASFLPEICEIMLKVRDYARENNLKLGSRQQAVIFQSDIIIRSLAKIGIIALVDEATGYQYEREKDELQKILKAYISEEILAWQLTFTDAFYKEIFRLKKWGDFTANGIKKRPGVVGKYTNEFVYEMLPPGVLPVLKHKTPKSEAGNYTSRLHQSLTPEEGRNHLKNQILVVTTLMSISRSWQEFKDLFARKFGQMAIDFEEKEEANPVQSNLSSLNQSLKKALDFNPKEKGK